MEDIRAHMNTYAGVWVKGRGNMIRNNQVVDMGGSTVMSYAHGIQAEGPGNETQTI
jgi:hypothetical protein